MEQLVLGGSLKREIASGYENYNPAFGSFNGLNKLIFKYTNRRDISKFSLIGKDRPREAIWRSNTEQTEEDTYSFRSSFQNN
jgi:hypothetical protein